MMNKKLFCTDLDDTLLATDKSVSEENIAAVRRLVAAGHYFAIVSGRSVAGTRLIFNKLGIETKNCFLVSFQGNVIYDLEREEIIKKGGMDPELVIDLIKTCQSKGIYAQTYTTESVYIPVHDDTSKRILGITGEKYTMIEDYNVLKGKVLPKVIIIDYNHPEVLPPLKEELDALAGDRANSFFSCIEYLEYCKAGQDKGVGLADLAACIGVDIKDTIAIGDERNDLSMIKTAGVGIAMANAHPELKAVADCVTERDMNHSGVAEAVDKFLLGINK